MCGIAGILNLDGAPVDRRLLERMTAALAHRGPDGEGIWVDGAVGFGHRRLAIRDLAQRARQPMSNLKAEITVTYNGEIYNDYALRRQLGPGVEFHTTCDTEVIAPAYRLWGAAAFERFYGMFALGLWDAAQRTLVLARDPIGIKPLYFSVVGRSLRFASEIKALLALDDQPVRIDPHSLNRFLGQGYPGPEHTLLDGIRPLPPGSLLTADRDGYRVHRYWSPRRTGAIDDLDAALEEFDVLWDEVVEQHLISDVPVGLFLSGGIDSCLIATGLRSRSDVFAFTASFLHRDFDETAAAAEIAQTCGLSHETVIADTEHGITDRFLAMVHAYDGHCADLSGFAFHAICEVASRRTKVVLSGEGGDEFFGGYQTYRASRLAAMAAQLLPRNAARCAANLLKGAGRAGTIRVPTSEKIFRWLSGIATTPDCPHPQWRRYAFAHHLQLIYTPEMLACVGGRDPLEDYAHAVRNSSGTLVDRCLVADELYYLPGDLLVKADTMSMAHGLELRVPFLDRRIMEFAGRLTSSLLTPMAGPDKRILREKLRRQGIPTHIVAGKKRGFQVPVARLLRRELRALGDSLLSRDADLLAPYLTPDGLRRMWLDHQEQRANNGYVLWAILTLAAWLSGKCRSHAAFDREEMIAM